MRRKPYGAIMDDILGLYRTRLEEERRLARILELMDAEAGTPEGDELDRLTNEQMEAERGFHHQPEGSR